MGIKVAINGFGRIGRNVFKLIQQRQDVTVVAINDLTNPETLAHLLKYDSVHGVYPGTISVSGNELVVDGQTISIYAERQPDKLPWGKLAVDVVIESTGVFRAAKSAKGGYEDHLLAGAKKVILTVPAKDDIQTVVLGVNSESISPDIFSYSNASCTTNCLAPVAKVLHDSFGIKKGFMNTVHSYTNDQHILDLPHSDLRRARAAGVSIIPTSTGAAKAVGLVLPELNGRLDGMAMRVPTPNGSVVDFVCEVSKSVDVQAVNDALKQAADTDMKGIMQFMSDPIVSCDIIGNSHSSVVDSLLTMCNGNMVKVISWYDNEYGYSSRVVDLIVAISDADV